MKVKTKEYGKGSRYRARFIDPEGNERSKSFPDGQYKRAQEWSSRQEVAVSDGTYIDPKSGEVPLNSFATRWIADLDIDELSRQTLEMRFRKRIIPHLGTAAIGSVKPSTVRSWDRWLREEGLSSQYRHTLFANLSAMFSAAREDGLIAANPCAGKSAKQPKVNKKKIVPWQEKSVWDTQNGLPEKFRVSVDLCAGAGLRQGECFGLSVDDVDFENNVIHVRRQVKKIRSKHVFALPKYEKCREVPLSTPVADALKEHMRRFPPKEITLPWARPEGAPHTARLIMTSAWGKVIDAKDFNKDRWKKALVSAELPHGKYENGMHALRHFFASVLLDKGESIKAVSEWLGHADAAFTLRTYTHLMPSSGDRTRKVIDGLYDRRESEDAADGPQTA
ncbi:tyrosine-type recombinase/integrase [Saccharopolyspora sp. 6V]|uniref:tyrosine-type recombinase/integrase n=1 Tax=Saccharopolyspora sp. 6V TaxID=2877239 RepID=UPI001CD3C5DC|nr:tyrosine-type recombinase/integrase [Saccharopolyspora sp. 6V]MCA1195348.1 site-specific integrase [Saccharopolyspora sp. 6V]